ncbi:hypothetical protein Goshw_016355 [Gossypium schwendimanii]|uniref:Uncharacterized protein n=1 Tax=Gossypium schwendimanii TaxID=34291 RepID=A0A7J9KST3_GOSSC|nr:hypothetical protein [Gossypium schwendimanii]
MITHYVEFCFKTFGDRVKTGMTFNEPRVVAALGFDNGINPLNRCTKQFGNCTDGNSVTEPYIAAHHLILSHAEAVKRYRMDDPGNLTFPKSLHDSNRVNFYRSYLKELKRAMNDGADITGYFTRSILDNFE